MIYKQCLDGFVITKPIVTARFIIMIIVNVAETVDLSDLISANPNNLFIHVLYIFYYAVKKSATHYRT